MPCWAAPDLHVQHPAPGQDDGQVTPCAAAMIEQMLRGRCPVPGSGLTNEGWVQAPPAAASGSSLATACPGPAARW